MDDDLNLEFSNQLEDFCDALKWEDLDVQFMVDELRYRADRLLEDASA